MIKYATPVLGCCLSLSGLLLSATSAAESFASQGPITALQQLESAPTLSMHPVRRHFAIQHWTTTGGTDVWFVASQQLPMLDLRLVFNAGSARDAQHSGLAMLTSGLVFEGTTHQSSLDISRTFEKYGAQYSTSCARDMSLIDVRTLSETPYLQPVLAELAEVLHSASFPQAAFNRVKNQQLTGLQEELQTPKAQVSRLFWTQLYAGQPYGSMPEGTPAAVEALQPQDTQAFYHQYFNRRNAVLVMVGSVETEKAHQIAEQLSQALPQGEPAPALSLPVPPAKPIQQHLEFPSEQTHILLGGLGISRNDPDYFALSIGNEMLGGGGFSSLLTREIRVKRGLSYGAGSYFIPMQIPGPVIVSMQTRSDQTATALEVTRKVIQDFVEQGPSDLQLRETQDHILGSYPLSLASNFSILGNLAAMGFYHLPENYLEIYPERISQVTLQQVRRVDARYFAPAHWVTVTVGRTESEGTKQKQ